jgi:hypothetical protein
VLQRAFIAGVLALLIGACGSSGGGAAPAGGGTTTDAPKPTQAPVKTAGPSGNPDVDNYGY